MRETNLCRRKYYCPRKWFLEHQRANYKVMKTNWRMFHGKGGIGQRTHSRGFNFQLCKAKSWCVCNHELCLPYLQPNLIKIQPVKLLTHQVFGSLCWAGGEICTAKKLKSCARFSLQVPEKGGVEEQKMCIYVQQKAKNN